MLYFFLCNTAQRKVMKMEENLFDEIHDVFKRYVVAEDHYLTALTLWTLHTHVYNKFGVTPRLLLHSPVPECGKTTVFNIIDELANRSEMVNEITPAAMASMMDTAATILADEGDNLRIQRNSLLRAILNGNNLKATKRYKIGGEVVKISLFTPVAIASIGMLVPSLMSRCVIVNLHQAGPDAKFTEFDLMDQDQMGKLARVHVRIYEWAEQVRLNTRPEIPERLRKGDNWRPLLSIADSLDRGDKAREAAAICMAETNYTDERILHLRDTRKVFNKTKHKGMPSRILVEYLNNLEDGEASEELTQKKLANVLNAFGVYTQSIWWPEGIPQSQQQSLKGYKRSDLEKVWSKYAVGPAEVVEFRKKK